MPEFQFQSGTLSATYGSVPASTQGTTVTSSVTGEVDGAWVELTAATTHAASWVLIGINNAQVSFGNNFTVDIGIGGSGSEQIIIPDLYFRQRSAGSGGLGFLFPVAIPAGTRLAARCAESSGAEATVEVTVTLFSGAACSPASPSIVSAYCGASPSLGVNVDPGGTANTDSAWVEMTAGTTRDHNWLVLTGRFGDLAIAQTRWMVDLAIGGAGSEQVIVSDLLLTADIANDFPMQSIINLPIFVPVGTRISARARSSSIVDGDRDIFLNLYGC